MLNVLFIIVDDLRPEFSEAYSQRMVTPLSTLAQTSPA